MPPTQSETSRKNEDVLHKSIVNIVTNMNNCLQYSDEERSETNPFNL